MNTKLLGANIRKYRQERGYTQDKAAELCGLSTNYFRQIELGNKTPKLETFLTIAEVLGTSTDRLLAGNVSWTQEIQSEELYEKIQHLPVHQREYILNALNTLVDGFAKF